MAARSPNGSDNSVVFLMVPFPEYSHLNQLLRLSHIIHSRGFPVHYAAPDTDCRLVKLRQEETHIANSSGIIFHQLLKPPFWMSLNEPVAALVRELSWSAAGTRTRRLVIIHDFIMTDVVQDAASLPNAETYSFSSSSVIFNFCLMSRLAGNPFPLQLAIPTIDDCLTPEVVSMLCSEDSGLERRLPVKGRLFNTCRSMEGPYIDLLSQTETVENHWAISPLFPVPSNQADQGQGQGNDKTHPTLEWLHKQPPRSVIYVSFGSTTTMTHEQIKELALGLEQSKQRFLWVLRNADTDVFNAETKTLDQLPDGFEDRVKGVGKVTRDWAPQLAILGHPSVGGFMSHCGWNSCLESLAMDVPLLTWPMKMDQLYNAVLITDVLKVGVPVISWRERNELVTSSRIKRSIECLFSCEGHTIGKRAEDLGKSIRESVDHDHWELNSFLAYAAR